MATEGNKLIADSADIAEAEGRWDEGDEVSNLTATESPDPSTMNFYVQMHGYTMADFETLVVNAAAVKLLGPRTFQEEIKAAVNKIASDKVNAEITKALKDVMGMTVTTRGKEPVTLSQMIGMEAKDYLTTIVNESGEPSSNQWDRTRTPRIAYLVGKFVRSEFAAEINSAFKTLNTEIREAVSSQLSNVIEAERQKLADGLGFELKKSR